MKQLIGIHHPFSLGFYKSWPNTSAELKHHALLLDRICLPGLTLSPEDDMSFLHNLRQQKDPQASIVEWGIAEANNLLKEGYICPMFNTDLEKIPENVKNLLEPDYTHNMRVTENLLNEAKNEPEKKRKNSELLYIIHLSQAIIEQMALLANKHQADVISLLPLVVPNRSRLLEQQLPILESCYAAGLILKKIPVPSEDTPWENIIEWRNDPDSKSRLFALRRWMRNIEKASSSPREIEDELVAVLHEYEQHMILHRLKLRTAKLETVVKMPLEILENLLKIKWSKLVDPIFTVRKAQISYREAELKAPGREVSYIVKTQERFFNSDNSKAEQS